MKFKSPINSNFTPKKYDKFGVLRPANVVGEYWSKIPHSGVDLRPHETGGTRSVYAIADGIITTSTDKSGAYYYIDHGNGWGSIYVHVTNRPLKVWTRVKAGQLLGSYSTKANHLHLTLRKDGRNVNPEDFINFNDTIKGTVLKRYYTVKSGDTLSKIARDELKDARLWRSIYNLNKDVIGSNSNMIIPGQKLELP